MKGKDHLENVSMLGHWN